MELQLEPDQTPLETSVPPAPEPSPPSPNRLHALEFAFHAEPLPNEAGEARAEDLVELDAVPEVAAAAAAAAAGLHCGQMETLKPRPLQ